MLTKILQKVTNFHQNVPHASVSLADLKPRVAVHYGIPSTASVLAFDPVQHLLAIGTQDGKIKVIGGDNIEGLLISPKPLPFKNLEFFQNQGFLVSVSNENGLQVWDLEHRCITSELQWESNITAFSIIYGTHYMYVGDEYGFLSLLKYDAEKATILPLDYHIPANLIDEVAELSSQSQLSIVGVLPQPGSFGHRVLIAYENGLIILWDVTEDRTVVARGNKDLHLKDKIVIHSPNGARHEHSSDTSDNEQMEKEISSLCWVSSDGSILAVGYVDGDILLWNLSDAALTKDQKVQNLSNNVIKLQLSSADRRLPVIVLHWSANSAHNSHGGQLFVYGGDEIGSEEILTIMSLDWSSGIQTLKCVYRVDLTLDGSFADMILMPNAGATESSTTSTLFVLTNPGQLHFYDDACLSSLASQSGKKHSVHAVQYPTIIPTIEPYMTVGKLTMIHKEGEFSRALAEAAAKLGVAHTITPASTNWPLTGGVPSQLCFAENKGIERVYIGGYRDGSVRIWDATFPTLSLLYVLGSEVEGIEVAGATASVSAVDFFSSTSSLAIGNECGLVRLHRLIKISDEKSLHFVTATKSEVHNLPHGNKNQCTAVFSLLNSPVRTLQYINTGARLAVGFECGAVAMIGVNSSQLLFLSESVSTSRSPVISLDVKTCPHPHNLEDNVNKDSNESGRELAFILTKDAHIILIDSTTGNIISSQLMHQNKDSVAISMYIIEGNSSVSEVSEQHSLISSQGSEAKTEPAQINSPSGSNLLESKFDPSSSTTHLGKTVDSYILLCCEDALLIYSPVSVIQGNKESSFKMNLVKPCCWTTIFQRDKQVCGLVLVYQTGEIEIRSLPDLKVVGQTSLMSILRWSFKTNMDKTMSSSHTGQISLANGCEFAFISLFAFENDFRIPEALPCLHDTVLAAASDAAFSVSSNQKKDAHSTAPGLFGGLIQGLKGGKPDHAVEHIETRENVIAHLESIFSRVPFSDLSTSIDLSTNIPDDRKVVELDIDDIQIDDRPISSVKITKERKDKEIEREKLFEGGSTDAQPKMRTTEEIRAKYRKTGDATSAAAHARDKLVERKEKLEKLSLRTEELQSGAENFSSLAGELAKQMQNRKWWQL